MIAIIFLILIIPLPTPFSRQIPAYSAFGGYLPGSSYPGHLKVVENSSVDGSWSTATGQPVAFIILDGSGLRTLGLTAGTGTFHFVAKSPPYVFIAVTLVPDTVTVNGTVNQALLIGIFEGD